MNDSESVTSDAGCKIRWVKIVQYTLTDYDDDKSEFSKMDVTAKHSVWILREHCKYSISKFADANSYEV